VCISSIHLDVKSEKWLINLRFAGRASFPAFVNPKPLAGILPDLVLDTLRQFHRSGAHVSLFISGCSNGIGGSTISKYFPFSSLHGAKTGTSGVFVRTASLATTNVVAAGTPKKSIKDRFVVERVQVGKKTERRFTGAKYFQASTAPRRVCRSSRCQTSCGFDRQAARFADCPFGAPEK
jgi:hypothetical protein